MRHVRWILTAAVLCGSSAWAVTPMPMAQQQAGSNPSGVDLAGIDHSVKPGDDFDGYANGTWKKTAVIPADRASTGIFLQVFEKAEKRNAELIKAAPRAMHPAAGSQRAQDRRLLRRLHGSGRIEKHGLKPLKPELAQYRRDQGQGAAICRRVLGSAAARRCRPDQRDQLQTPNTCSACS
jgi:putative endopeptidase